MINLLKSRRRYTQEKQWGMFRDGKCKTANGCWKAEGTMKLQCQKRKRNMYRRNWKHLKSKTESNEDETIELSDDEDKANNANVKSENVTNDEERIVEPEEIKSEIRTR